MKKHNDPNPKYEDAPVPAPEGYYDDYYPEEDPYTAGGAHLTEEARERYYAERDAYYAQRDAYYAQRDAYYARREVEEDEEEGWETAPAPVRRRRAETDPRDYLPEDTYAEPDPVRQRQLRRRSRRRGRVFRRLLLLLLAAALVLMLTGQAPVRAEEGRSRIPGRSTVLLAGTDREGYRTDTIVLLTLDQHAGTASLLSIPRDTYAPAYAVPKINSAYGAAGGGERGMEELMGQVKNVLGFSPDAYVLVDMDVLTEAVDLLGGLDFDVPQDMQYVDLAQDLIIDLRAGLQHLTGDQVMQLLRFRSGYANADIGRTEVQRSFLKEAVRQWLKPSNLKVFPQLWSLFREKTVSDLSFRELMWIARVLVKADREDMEAAVLPGWADMAGDASVYMVDQTALQAMLPAYSPYG